MPKEKIEHEFKHKPEHDPIKEHNPHCDCGEKCACETTNNAKCSCGCGCSCGNCSCGSNCQCGCHKKCGSKFIILLLAFFAGIGFNQLWHNCIGRCTHNMPHKIGAMHAPMPAVSDGGTTIIINTADGCADVWSSKNHLHKHHKHHKNMHMANPKNPIFNKQSSVQDSDTTSNTAE